MAHYMIMELLGTFFLTMAIAFAGEAVPVGLMLMAMVYIGSHLSGAHYNPAVSVASWMRGGLKNEELLSYVGVQTAGALLALWVARTVTGTVFSIELPASAQMVPFFMEMLLAMALCLVVLTVAKVSGYKGSGVNGLAIGFTFAALMAVGPNPTVLNPAVALGSLLSGLIDGAGFGPWNVVFVYVVGPMVGGAVASWMFAYLNDKK